MLTPTIIINARTGGDPFFLVTFIGLIVTLLYKALAVLGVAPHERAWALTNFGHTFIPDNPSIKGYSRNGISEQPNGQNGFGPNDAKTRWRIVNRIIAILNGQRSATN